MAEDLVHAPMLPGYYDASPRTPAVKSQSIRTYLTPVNGATFGSNAQMIFELSSGPGVTLDPSQTCLSFRINNASGTTLALDKSAASVISQIDIFHGAKQLSSISEYHLLQDILTCFSTGVDDNRTTGTVKGTADYLPTAIATAADFATAYYSRRGATIASGGNLTVCIPLVTIMSSLSLRSWPIHMLKENIRIVIKLADQLDFGIYGAVPAGNVTVDNAKLWHSLVVIPPGIAKKMIEDLGGIATVPCLDFTQTSMSVAPNSQYVSMPISVRVRSATAIFVAIRPTASLLNRLTNNLDRSPGGDSFSTVSYRFRIGSTVVPSSGYVAAGAESRVELMRAFGQQLSESSSRTCISNAEYLTTGFVLACSLQSFPMTDALDDGTPIDSTIILEMNLGAQSAGIRLDAWVQHEKTLALSAGGVDFLA